MHNARRTTSTRFRRAARALLPLLAAGSAAGCRESLRALGPNAAVAESHADALFEAFVARFSNVDISPQYETARVKIAQSALVPSRVFDEESAWSGKQTGNTHVLYVNGTFADNRYRLDVRPAPAPPVRIGDTRHIISLEQLGGSAYRWDTKVDMAIGTVTADEFANLITALFAAPEGHSEAGVREDYRTAFPRAAAVFGRGFSVDSLRVVPGALGTTSVTLTLGFHPELMKPTYPALAGYLDKYLGPAKYHFALADRGGVPLLDAIGRDRAVTIRYRVQQGKLTSLSGPPRAWGDSLVLAADVSLKVKVFTVGFHSLLTDFVLSDDDHERAWTFVARREPRWDLPFVAERLLRTPLRRPFEGAGSMFRLSIRDSAGAQSLWTRRGHLEVQESAIMRFIGSLASHALGDLDNRVELDEHRFVHDGFAALQADLRTLMPRGK